MIVVFGSLTMDLLFSVPVLPGPGETVLGRDCDRAPGGKGANQAVAAARAGAEVALAGCVGRDAFGDELLEAVAAAGPDCGCVRRADAPTAVAAVAVAADGENQIVVAAGANLAATAASVSAAMLERCTTLVMQREVPGREVRALARRARAVGGRVIMNAAPAGPIEPGMLDVVVANAGESVALAAALGLEERAPERIATRLAHDHGLSAVVTLGAEGAVAAASGERWRIGSLAVRPVDTVGAGDAFVGTLAAALDSSQGLAEALRRASVAGALACLKPGAMPALPDAAEVDAHLGDLAPARAF